MATVLDLTSINEIVQKSKRVFLALPGVIKINPYGSIKNRKVDSYSDIDLEVISDNPKATTKNLKNSLGRIGHPYVILPISIAENERIYTIVWKDYSFYQKTDLRLLFTINFPPKKGLIKYDENLRKFHSFFIGIIRYTKYRKRKMHWTAYKFYKAAIEMWLELKTGGQTLDNFIKLDKSSKGKLNKWIYPKNREEMDKHMTEIAKSFLKLSSHNDDFGQRVVKFMRVELKS